MLPVYIVEIRDDTERQWIAELYTQYSKPLCRLIQSYVPLQDTSDILQDTFMEVIRHSARLREFSNKRLYAYIVRIAHSRAMNALRKLKKERERNAGDEELKRLLSREEAPDEQVITRLTCVQAGKLLEKVEERYRNVFLLKYSQHFNDREIARLTGLSVNSVWKYASRAESRLLELAAQELAVQELASQEEEEYAKK